MCIPHHVFFLHLIVTKGKNWYTQPPTPFLPCLFLFLFFPLVILSFLILWFFLNINDLHFCFVHSLPPFVIILPPPTGAPDEYRGRDEVSCCPALPTINQVQVERNKVMHFAVNATTWWCVGLGAVLVRVVLVVTIGRCGSDVGLSNEVVCYIWCVWKMILVVVCW